MSDDSAPSMAHTPFIPTLTEAVDGKLPPRAAPDASALPPAGSADAQAWLAEMGIDLSAVAAQAASQALHEHLRGLHARVQHDVDKAVQQALQDALNSSAGEK